MFLFHEWLVCYLINMVHGIPCLFKVFKTLLWSFSMEYWLIRLRQRGLVSIFPFAYAYQLVSEFLIVWYMLFRSSLSIYWVFCLSYVFSQKYEGEFVKLGVLDNASMYHGTVHLTCLYVWVLFIEINGFPYLMSYFFQTIYV